MKWLSAVFFGRVETDEKDGMGNPVFSDAKLFEARVRATVWGTSEEGGEGNRFDAVERTFMTMRPLDDVRAASSVIVGVESYIIGESADLGRFRVFRAKRCKP